MRAKNMLEDLRLQEKQIRQKAQQSKHYILYRPERDWVRCLL